MFKKDGEMRMARFYRKLLMDSGAKVKPKEFEVIDETK